MAEKQTHNQSGYPCSPKGKTPPLVKAPPTGAPSLKQPGNSKPVGNPKA